MTLRKFDQNKIDSLFERAIGHRDSNEFEEAIKLFEQILKSPEIPESYMVNTTGVLGGVFLENGEPARAQGCFELVVQHRRTSLLASQGLFHSLLDQGLKSEAIIEAERYFSLAPSNTNVQKSWEGDYECYKSALGDVKAL